jgi:hypothetical protein
MDSVKVAENLAAGSVVKEVQIILENGGEANYSIALVNGKFAIDNAKFSFDVDGNIINNNILASGIYWIRYRATVGFDSVEKGLKIYTDDQEVEITLSDTEYEYDIATDGVVATVSLSAGSTSDVTITPQSDEDDSGLPAFEYDGPSGEIRWSGDQSPLDYTYNIQYTGACIKPILNQEFTVAGAIEVDEGFYAEVYGHYTTHTWDQVRDLLDDAPLTELPAPIGSAQVRTYLQYSTSGNQSMIGAAWKVPATPGATSLSFSLGYQRYPGATGIYTALLYYQGPLPSTFSGLKSWTLKQYANASSGSAIIHWDDILPSLDLTQPFYIATVPAKWYDDTGNDYGGSGSSPFIAWNINSAPSIS